VWVHSIAQRMHVFSASAMVWATLRSVSSGRPVMREAKLQSEGLRLLRYAFQAIHPLGR